MRGRHCIICKKPGGSGLTAAARAIHEQCVRVGKRSPFEGITLIDIKAHGSCMSKLKRQYSV